MKRQGQKIEAECLGLIEALGSETFFNSFWEKKPFSAPFCSSFVGDLNAIAIEQLIASVGVPDRNWIQLVRDGKGFTHNAFTNSEGFVDLLAIRQAFEEGYTVQLSKIQIRHAQVGQLCREFEGTCIDQKIDLTRPIGSHLYITPPHRRGLLPHYDDHNVLVLQLAGVKHWRLYSAPSKPIARQIGEVREECLPPLTDEIELRAGHVLYVPRGCYHEASTGAEQSTHLTLDIYTLTLFDLLQEALRRLPSLGASVPHGFSEIETGALVKEQIAPSLAHLDFSAALTAIRREFVSNLYPLPSGGLSSLVKPTINSMLHHRSGVLPRVRYQKEGVILNFIGGSITADLLAADLLNFVASNTVFSVSAIPLGPDSEKLEFAYTLVDAGLAEIRP